MTYSGPSLFCSRTEQRSEARGFPFMGPGRESCQKLHEVLGLFYKSDLSIKRSLFFGNTVVPGGPLPFPL